MSLSGDSDIIGKTLRPIHKGYWMAFVTEILEWNLKLCCYQSCKLHSKLNAFVRSVIRELQSYWLKMGGRLQAIHDMFVFVLCIVSVHMLMSSKRKGKQNKNTQRKSKPREEKEKSNWALKHILLLWLRIVYTIRIRIKDRNLMKHALRLQVFVSYDTWQNMEHYHGEHYSLNVS